MHALITYSKGAPFYNAFSSISETAVELLRFARTVLAFRLRSMDARESNSSGIAGENRACMAHHYSADWVGWPCARGCSFRDSAFCGRLRERCGLRLIILFEWVIVGFVYFGVSRFGMSSRDLFGGNWTRPIAILRDAATCLPR
jgi:hypothetical protein